MTRAQWLTADQQRTWRVLVTTMQRLDEALDRQLQRDADMPHAYYGLLVGLSESTDGTARMSELARYMGHSASRVSHAVTAMEARRWVQREPCPEDRRVIHVRITPAGRAALAAAAPGHVALVRRVVFAPLSRDQQHEVRDACARILDALADVEASLPFVRSVSR